MAREIYDNIFLIDLDQPRRGFEKFISSWLVRREGATILVDPGPSSSIPRLEEELETLAVKKIDFVLITHIHIDHVGGLGHLLERHPEARVVCKPSTVRHLTEPSKLSAASRQALGDLADLYGTIRPSPEEAFLDEYEASRVGLFETVETPGHASHHRCYLMGDILFVGEAAGVFYPHESGPYLRLASPAPFFYDVYRSSLLKAASLDVSHLCFAHYGFCDDPPRLFDAALNQLDLWVALTEKRLNAGEDEELFEESVFEDLLKRDRAMTWYREFPRDVQERERYFAVKSIRGIHHWIQKNGAVRQ
ncbi:MAG: hypothetical protein AVO39_09040 [delta proteobacterium MLS_D]|jgi:glyoxylase-like metal-dependent hydrolase (beta-lactamase superfamily II)|nr:MAG: hypothetical protein AVO39_09040 [delta proteobacterium MLS_D]